MTGRGVAGWMLAGCSLALGVACGGEQEAPAASGPTITDSAGVRMVVNQDPLWRAGEGWRLTPEPVLTLGTLDTPLEQQFHRVGGVTRLDDGTIVVLNRGSSELRAFDSSGRHLWSRGGAGDGPGEMKGYADAYPELLRLAGDSLQVQNGWDRIRFDRAGQLVAHETLGVGQLRALGPYHLYTCPFGPNFLDDQILVCNDYRRPPQQVETWASRVTIARTSWALEQVDTVATLFETDWGREDNPWRTLTPSPFGRNGLYRVSGQPRPTLLYATNDAYRIEVWDVANAALSMVVERRTARRARGERENNYASKPGPVYPITEGMDPRDRRWSPVDSLSLAQSFRLDALGYLWVRRAPSPSEGDEGVKLEVSMPDGTGFVTSVSSGLHDLFRPDGVYLGTVKLPYDFRIMEIGPDYLLGMATDDLGIEYVHMYGLDRGLGGPVAR